MTVELGKGITWEHPPVPEPVKADPPAEPKRSRRVEHDLATGKVARVVEELTWESPEWSHVLHDEVKSLRAEVAALRRPRSRRIETDAEGNVTRIVDEN
jgi:hypothetical protein